MNPQNSLFDESLNCGEDFSIVKQELIQKFQENNFEYFHNGKHLKKITNNFFMKFWAGFYFIS